MVNINLDLQWQLQYMVNIKLDFAVAATIHGQYQPRPTVTATIYMVNINLDLQWQQQYTANINHDASVAAAIYGQYQPRPIMM